MLCNNLKKGYVIIIDPVTWTKAPSLFFFTCHFCSTWGQSWRKLRRSHWDCRNFWMRVFLLLFVQIWGRFLLQVALQSKEKLFVRFPWFWIKPSPLNRVLQQLSSGSATICFFTSCRTKTSHPGSSTLPNPWWPLHADIHTGDNSSFSPPENTFAATQTERCEQVTP